MNLSSQPFDNRKIYLNGLCIRVLEQTSNGDVKISLRWNDFDINKNVRWCGDIVLNEKVIVKPNSSVLLDQGLTPTRPINPIVFNGQKIFANPTVFTAKGGSFFKAETSGFIFLKNNTSYIAESGSILEVNDKSIFTVDTGSTLQIKTGASLIMKGSGKIVIKSGGYLCVEQGANIDLQDYNSLIILEEGAVLGTNPSLLPGSSCSSTIVKTGNGSVVDYSQDVYIQNETISTNRYIAGKNIFVGNHVTTAKPYGDVFINNGANIIFDCKEITFDSGFESVAGSTYEVINH